MECAGHVMSHAPFVSICECTVCKMFRRLSGSLSSGIGLSALQLMSSVDVVSDVTCVSGMKSVGEHTSIIFKVCLGPLQIYSRWYELPLDPCPSGDFSVAQVVENNTMCAILLAYTRYNVRRCDGVLRFSCACANSTEVEDCLACFRLQFWKHR